MDKRYIGGSIDTRNGSIPLQDNNGVFNLGVSTTNYKPWLDKALSLLPINVGTLGRSIFTPRNMTELDFNQDEINAMRNAYKNSRSRMNNIPLQDIYQNINKLSKKYPQNDIAWYEGVNYDKPVTYGMLEEESRRLSTPNSIQYIDYNNLLPNGEYDNSLPHFTNDNIAQMAIHSLFGKKAPEYRVATTLGSAFYNTDPNGNVIIMMIIIGEKPQMIKDGIINTSCCIGLENKKLNQ